MGPVEEAEELPGHSVINVEARQWGVPVHQLQQVHHVQQVVAPASIYQVPIMRPAVSQVSYSPIARQALNPYSQLVLNPMTQVQGNE